MNFFYSNLLANLNSIFSRLVKKPSFYQIHNNIHNGLKQNKDNNRDGSSKFYTPMIHKFSTYIHRYVNRKNPKYWKFYILYEISFFMLRYFVADKRY